MMTSIPQTVLICSRYNNINQYLTLRANIFNIVKRGLCHRKIPKTLSTQYCRNSTRTTSLNQIWCQFRSFSTSQSSRYYYNKSDIVKDVLLYRSDSSKLFYLIGAFAGVQMLFWGFLAQTAFTTMRDTELFDEVRYADKNPTRGQSNWSSIEGIKMKMSTKFWRYGVTILSLSTGIVLFVAALTYCRRSVQSLYLRKGGDTLTFVTYGYFGLRRAFTVPVDQVGCQHGRNALKSTLPIKVKGHRFYYVLTMKEGTFHNGRLFDATAGAHRSWL